MSLILLKNIDVLATFNEDRTVINNAWLLIQDNRIASYGKSGSEPIAADQVLDMSGQIVIPGLINTHHHHFQTLIRNVPSMQNASLFNWLHDLYLLMSEVTDEDQYVSSMIAQAELLLSGCTTNVEHSYLKVNDMAFDTEIKAAKEIGIRFHLARGSFSIGQSLGGLPPDHIIEKEDDILSDTERLIKTYHEPENFGMVRIDNAPCSPFSITPHLMTESIELARKYNVGNHTHLAESQDDEKYMHRVYGRSSVEMAQEWGWVGPDVWYAHAVQLSDSDINIMSQTHTCVAHCPNSNMFLASGICRVTDLLKKNVIVGLGVDGSASNNSSNMLDEVRNAMLVQRVKYGADALSPTQALEISTIGGAKLLRRTDIGSIEIGKAADVIGIKTGGLSFSGGLHDPIAALVMCSSGEVNLSIVNGKILVNDGKLLSIDLPALIQKQNELGKKLVQRTVKRYNTPLDKFHWRRAFPYDEV
ncbi:MAG: 8-oxoguanine deaminase [Flexilinea sp.]